MSKEALIEFIEKQLSKLGETEDEIGQWTAYNRILKILKEE